MGPESQRTRPLAEVGESVPIVSLMSQSLIWSIFSLPGTGYASNPGTRAAYGWLIPFVHTVFYVLTIVKRSSI